MLKKLTKYEFMSVAKIYIPIYCAVLALAVINKIMWRNGIENAAIPQAITMTAYIMLLTSMAVVTFVIGVTRFKKNLLSDQGYLMFTLPVKRSSLIMAKTIAATFWSFTGMLVAGVSIVILAAGRDFFVILADVGLDISKFLNQVGPIWIVYAILAAIISVLGMAGSYLVVYLAMAIGHMANKNKVAMSFAAYFAISLVRQTILSFAGDIFVNKYGNFFVDLFNNTAPKTLVLMALVGVLILVTVSNAIFFYGTEYAVKNKLNLE